MEDVTKEIKTEEKKVKKSKIGIFFKIAIVVWVIVILVCGLYLFNSFRMVKKYDVDKFKLGKFEIVTLNGVLNKDRTLVSASEKNGVITLKYDIKEITLNNVYEYLEELSSEGYTVVNLEELYMRVVDLENDIQIRIKIGSNHLVFEHNIGIDYDEKSDDEKESEEALKEDNQTEEDKSETQSEEN